MRGSPLGWIVVHWRLKLLALILTIGLLGAVAFSENPPELATVPVRVGFVNRPPDLVVMRPPSTIDVQVAGLQDEVERYRQSAAGVSIDLSRAHVGANQIFVAKPKTEGAGVTVRQPSIPISLTIEPTATRLLDIEVRTAKRSPGVAVIPEKTFATCGNSSDRCQVSVVGAASVLSDLKAYVDYDVSIAGANTQTSPNEPIKFEARGRPVDLGHDVRSLPAPSWTPTAVTVQVATQGGTLTRTVGVSVRVQGSQACGYVITGVDVQPAAFVTVTGPIDAVTRLSSVNLDSTVNITGLAATTGFNRMVISGSSQMSVDPQSVRVVVSVAQQFSCTAPSPAGGPLPAVSPTPSPTPRPSP